MSIFNSTFVADSYQAREASEAMRKLKRQRARTTEEMEDEISYMWTQKEIKRQRRESLMHPDPNPAGDGRAEADNLDDGLAFNGKLPASKTLSLNVQANLMGKYCNERTSCQRCISHNRCLGSPIWAGRRLPLKRELTGRIMILADSGVRGSRMLCRDSFGRASYETTYEADILDISQLHSYYMHI